MSRTTKFSVSLWLAIPLAVVVCQQAQAGKPAPPPSLPVEYQLTDIGSLPGGYTNAMSLARSSAVLVGISGLGAENQGAFVWNSSTGLVDLNALSSYWLDLSTGEEVYGWFAYAARDINDAGLVVGTARNGDEDRAFLLDLNQPAAGFQLLPNPVGATGNVQAFKINENGEVLLRSIVNDDYTQPMQYLWTPADPQAVRYAGIGFPAGLNNDKFLLFNESAYVATLYSYQFLPDGTLVTNTVAAVSATQISDLNDAGWFAYRQDTTRSRYIKICRPGSSTRTVYTTTALASLEAGVALSNSGDFVYEANGQPYVYRFSESKSYRLYDLLDVAAKSILYPGGTFGSRIGLAMARVNSSNAAGVPAADPYDHICGMVNLTDDPSMANWQAIVLTAVPK